MASITRDEVIAALVERKVKKERAVMYADQFVAYQTATANINEFGTIIKNPRTGAAMANPYLKVRDAALKELKRMHDVPASFLW